MSESVDSPKVHEVTSQGSLVEEGLRGLPIGFDFGMSTVGAACTEFCKDLTGGNLNGQKALP